MKSLEQKVHLLWPKHTSTSDAFFRYNARIDSDELNNKIANKQETIPENITSNNGQGNTGGQKGGTVESLKAYLEKEEHERKYKTKVLWGASNYYLRLIGILKWFIVCAG